MTVSDWGSARAPFVAPGFQQGRPRNVKAAVHPAHGGTDPRHDHQMYAQRAAATPYGAGPGPEYGAAYGAGYGSPHGAGYAADPYGEAGHPDPQAHGAPDPYGTAPHRGAAPGEPGQGGSTALNLLGALVSVALVVGLGVWGYKLAVRDVTGVPVVKALEGPMRIQPDDPGGVVAPHQGLAVNDVAAEGVSAGPVDQLKLAPPVAELKDEDVPARPETEAEVEVGRAIASPSTAPLPSSGAEINADAAVAEALGLTDIPGLDAPAPGAPASGAVPAPVIPESVPGVARSPRPMPRPAVFAPLAEIREPVRAVDVAAAIDMPPPARPTARSLSAATAPAVVLGYEVDPGEIDPSARLVQLGAFRSVEEARAGWVEIAGKNPELFRNRNWTIERRESGGTAFYRLRAIGFDGLQDARAFCAALIAAQGTCVPVVDTTLETVVN